MAGIQTDQGPLLGQAPMLLEQVLEEQMGRLESIMSSLLLTPLLVLVLGPRAELHPIDRSWVAVPPLLMRLPGRTITVPCQSNRATVPSLAEEWATSQVVSPT